MLLAPTAALATVSPDEKEFNSLLISANKGDAAAQNQVGNCYFHGKGVARNYGKAYGFYSKASETNYAPALNNLGFMWINGIGVMLVPEKGFAYCQKAAEQGMAEAQTNLGDLYYRGIGIARNYAKAVEFYRKAAEQGYSSAQMRLGVCYLNGIGIKKDLGAANLWLQQAAEQGDKAAKSQLLSLAANSSETSSAGRSVLIFADAKLNGKLRGSAVVNEESKTINWISKSRKMTLSILPAESNWSAFDSLNITFSASRAGDTFLLKLDSDSEATKGGDYFFKKFTIEQSGSQTLTIPLKSLHRQRKPLGFDHVQTLDLVFEGWGLKNVPGLELTISRIELKN
jgi:hypothetical protein